MERRLPGDLCREQGEFAVVVAPGGRTVPATVGQGPRPLRDGGEKLDQAGETLRLLRPRPDGPVAKQQLHELLPVTERVAEKVVERTDLLPRRPPRPVLERVLGEPPEECRVEVDAELVETRFQSLELGGEDLTDGGDDVADEFEVVEKRLGTAIFLFAATASRVAAASLARNPETRTFRR